MYGVGMVVGALLATRVMKAPRLRHRDRVGPGDRFCGGCVDGADTIVPRRCSRLELLPARVGPILWVISTTTLRQSVTRRRCSGASPPSYHELRRPPLGSALGQIVGGFYSAKPASISPPRSSQRKRW